MKIEITKYKDIFIDYKGEGHCNLRGMTTECYGCACYGGGLVVQCNEYVKKLKEYCIEKYNIPYDIFFDKNGKECYLTDEKLDKIIEILNKHNEEKNL